MTYQIFFTEDCDPVQLYNEKISCLMFVDDVILTSNSKEGLQKAIDKLQGYSRHWMLNKDK